MLNKYH